MSQIRWGILGLGNIANKFAQALANITDAKLVAVGSRNADKASAFGKQYNAGRFYGSYEELARDPDIDIIYIATPHSHHCQNATLCLENGKAVLCEKSFAANTAQARQMVETARQKKLFLMEAMWSRFLPAMTEVRNRIHNGEIGDVRIVVANFCVNMPHVERERLYAPHLAGGALLDVGVYPVSLCSMLLGKPLRIASAGFLSAVGTDQVNGSVLMYDDAKMGIAYSSFRDNIAQEATITGAKGTIKLLPRWTNGNSYQIAVNGTSKTVVLPAHENGFVYEIMAVQEALKAGKTECEIMGLDESISIMEMMDEMRRQFGLKYPFES